MKCLVVVCLMAVGASAQLGQSGVVMPDGNNRQFTQAEAENILLIGSSGAITADGKHIQLDADGIPVTRAKRSNILLNGPSAIIFKDGQVKKLDRDVVLVEEGPSGAVFSDGTNVQYRKKRSNILLEGPSGVLFKDGQYKHLGRDVTLVEEGPSGAVFSDGSNIQYRKKRSLTSPLIESIKGPSGYVTPTGQLYQLPPDVTVVIEGDTGALLSDGTAIQFFA